MFLLNELVIGRRNEDLIPKGLQHRHSDRSQSPGLHHDYDHARRIRTSRRDPRNDDHRVVRLEHSHRASVD
jgi:hypothetical protein